MVSYKENTVVIIKYIEFNGKLKPLFAEAGVGESSVGFSTARHVTDRQGCPFSTKVFYRARHNFKVLFFWGVFLQ